jgi:AbrB family looped-hinge helix DNA binding protein
MVSATVTSKGQITLPKDVRDDLQLKEGDKVVFEKVEGRYVLRPQNKNIMDLAGILHRPGEKTMSLDEIDEVLGQALAEDDARIRSYGTSSDRRR